jgi:hypothetical protein
MKLDILSSSKSYLSFSLFLVKLLFITIIGKIIFINIVFFFHFFHPYKPFSFSDVEGFFLCQKNV